MTAALTGLQPGTTYFYHVVATSTGGTTTGAILSFATPAASTVGPQVTNLQRFGFHMQPTMFVLTFNSALDPTRAQDVNNYQLVPLTGSEAGRPITITSAVYNPTTNTVTLLPATLVNVFQQYQLTVNGTSPSGLTDTSGHFLSGQGPNQPGTNFVQTFGMEILAGPNVTAQNMSRAQRARIMRLLGAHPEGS